MRHGRALDAVLEAGTRLRTRSEHRSRPVRAAQGDSAPDDGDDEPTLPGASRLSSLRR
jgi:hypothetical protein